MKATDDIKSDFFSFLLKGDYLPDFIHEVRRQSGGTYKGYMNRFKGEAENLVNDAFTWGNLPDGGFDASEANYWSMVDIKWKKRLSKKK